MDRTGEPRYRSQVYVCGALGRPDRLPLARLIAASPPDLQPVHAGAGAVLWATGRPRVWRQDGCSGHYWNPLAEDGPPGGWRNAAERRMSAGLVTDAGTATLHTDALGMAELYTRQLGGALYYASRIHPLTCLDERPLHQDRSAWASTLALGGPVGDETPFEEIRRVPAATAWQVSDGRPERLSFEPSWAGVEPDARPDARVVVDLVAQHVPRQRLVGRTALTLSGGWDSRFLAAVAARRSRRAVLAWTTDPDTGHDLDVRLSEPVAAALGMRQHVLVPPPRAWVRNAALVRGRVQHQTWLHTWLMPLASLLHARTEPLLDGLAGGVLLRSLFVDQGVLEAADPGRALWDRLSSGRVDNDHQLLDPAVAADLADASRASFATATAHAAGHPASAALSVLGTRTVRVVAASPLLLFGPEVDVRLPFLHPDVISAGLAVPVEHKIGGGYYRRLLHAADPDVARLPSTNDDHPRPTLGPRRLSHPAALSSMARLIRSDDQVRGLLAPALQDALTSRESMAAMAARRRGLDVLAWAAMLAEWRQLYRDRLAS